MDSLFNQSLTTSSSAATIGHFIHHHEEGSLFFNPEYQREYVWGDEEQQALLDTIFEKFPIDSVSVVENNDAPHEEFLEVVDGRQRITTCIKFKNNEIPYRRDGKEIYFRDLNRFDKRAFLQYHFPNVILSSNEPKTPVSLEQKLRYFYRANFSGKPQSAEHRAKIENMLAQYNK